MKCTNDFAFFPNALISTSAYVCRELSHAIAFARILAVSVPMYQRELSSLG